MLVARDSNQDWLSPVPHCRRIHLNVFLDWRNPPPTTTCALRGAEWTLFFGIHRPMAAPLLPTNTVDVG